MDLTPRLIDVRVPERPDGVVLLLHGGASRRGSPMVSPTQLSVLRMIPIARRVAREGRGRLAVFRLLNSVRGWDTGHTPAADARWALDQIADRLGAATPACVVGHSLGGRAALATLGRPEVRSVVALAPWVYATDAPSGRPEQRILFVHGTRDRIADPGRSAAVARAMSSRAEVSYVNVEGAKHAMLRRHAVFSGLAARFAAVTLLDAPPSGTLARVAAGERWITV